MLTACLIADLKEKIILIALTHSKFRVKLKHGGVAARFQPPYFIVVNFERASH